MARLQIVLPIYEIKMDFARNIFVLSILQIVVSAVYTFRRVKLERRMFG